MYMDTDYTNYPILTNLPINILADSYTALISTTTV